ncbi:MAG: DUF2079 domain-containing protein [Spirochaetota bacterium]|nr:DUF2079 domain-containing protein [Spirochaetota bacterium]
MTDLRNTREKIALVLDFLSIVAFLIIILIFITGGYRGAIFGIFISIRALLNPVLFLICIYIFRIFFLGEKIESSLPIKILLKIVKSINNNPGKFLILLSIYLIYFKILQHIGYDTYSHDLSVFDYPIHYTLNGKFMYYPWWDSITNYLGIHFSPILLAIVPLYVIFDSPVILLILQGLFISLALIPLFKISEESKFTKEEKLLIGLAFIFNPYTWEGFIYNFHIEVLYPLLFFSAYYTVIKKRYILHSIFIVIILLIKEDAFIYCIMLELFFLIFTDNRRIAILNIALSLIWGIMTLKVIMPSFYIDGNMRNLVAERYGHMGSNFVEIISYILTHPIDMFKLMFNKAFGGFLLSFAFLPVLYMKLSIFALPSIFINLLSRAESQSNLGLYYAMSAIPFYFIAIAISMERFHQKWRKRLLLLIFIIGIVCFRTTGCMIPDYNDFKAHFLFANFHTKDGISAQSNIVPHLPRYKNMKVYPERDGNTIYIMLKLTGFNGVNKSRIEYYKEILHLIDNEGFTVGEYFFPFVILNRDDDRSEGNEKELKVRLNLVKLISEIKHKH